MTNPRRLDQAPQHQHNPASEAAAGAPHIEQFDFSKMSLQEAIDKGLVQIPSQPTAELRDPARFRENPIVTPTQPVVETEKKSNLKRNLLIGAGVLTTATAVGIAALTGGSSKGNSNDRESPLGSGTSTSAPEVSGQGNELPPLDMYNTDITHEDYGRQLDVILPYLEEHREQSLREVADELNAENRVPLPDPNEHPEGSDMHRAVIDQNNITADLWTISGEQNTTLARNLLNGVFWNNPESSTDAYDLTEELIGNGKGRIKEYTHVYETSPVITQGMLGTTEVEGPESYIALLGSRTSGGKAYEQVIGKRVSQDGRHSNNVVIESIQWGDRGFVEHPAQVTGES